MYTAGYRYDWENGLLKEIGAISIDIIPKTAMVFINGQKIKDTMPIRLKNVTPGKYIIRLSATGHYDWQKEISVKNKQTVYIKEVSLLKKTEPELLLAGNFSQLSLSTDGRYLLYTAINNQSKKLILRDLDESRDTELLTIPAGRELEIIWSEKNNFAAVTDQNYPHQWLAIINAARPNLIWELTKETKTPIQKIQWRDTINPELYYSTKTAIVSATPENLVQTAIAKNTFLDWRMNNGQLWTIQLGTAKGQIRLVKDTLGFPENFSLLNGDLSSLNVNSWQILAVRDDIILLKKSEQTEMLIVTADKKFPVSGEKFTISKYNNWWLIWTPWELWTYSKGEEPYLLNRSGEQLREVAPLDKYNTLALVWAKKTTALFPYYLVGHELIDHETYALVADSEKRTLFFADQKGLWKLNY